MERRRLVLATGVAALSGSLALSACGGGGSASGPGGSGGKAAATTGGTLTVLTQSQQLQHLDPQRVYTGEDLAFLNAYTTRTLTAYKALPGGAGNELVPDLATDTGKAGDGGKTWAFTIRDGATWEDGTPVTCADVKYGVSRTFAQDVITDGPTYAISMLDVPKDSKGAPVYKGPYAASGSDTAAFDKAVTCSSDNKTITFHLARPVGDFNYTVTLTAFSAVPKAKDGGEKYDDRPFSDGPYKIQEYTKGQQLVLVRNDQWRKEGDDYRPAYPDTVVVKFGGDAALLDQRMQADAGEDQTAVNQDPVEPASLASVFNDPRFADRRINDLDVFVSYLAINTKKVPNLKHRQAIMAALDRAQLRTIAGGSFAGDLGDGVVKPNLAKDYAPSGVWDTLLGAKVPDSGDPELAKKLIAESGEPMPVLKYDYNQTPTNDKAAASMVESLKRAGITLVPNPIEQGHYYSIVLDPAKEDALALSGWGADWPNASTVVPELFTPAGGFNLSQADDKAFNAKAEKAKAELDRDKQAGMWQELNKEAMANAWAIPTRFRREQRLAGSRVHAAHGENGKTYLWTPYGSWPYLDLYVS
ncbi:MAG: ABC transporter substrate-binding protein [Motilibacteraceae bacterium]